MQCRYDRSVVLNLLVVVVVVVYPRNILLYIYGASQVTTGCVCVCEYRVKMRQQQLADVEHDTAAASKMIPGYQKPQQTAEM